MVEILRIVKHRETHNKVECQECGNYFTETVLRLRHWKQCTKIRKNNVENSKDSEKIRKYPRVDSYHLDQYIEIVNAKKIKIKHISSGTCGICGQYFDRLRDHTRQCSKTG